MRRIGLIFGLLTTATMAMAEQPAVPRDLTETTAPFTWLPGDHGTSGEGVRIRRGAIPEPPPPPVAAPVTRTRTIVRRERERSRYRNSETRRDVIIFVTKNVPPEPPAPPPSRPGLTRSQIVN
ncbi:MAG: hypothetical protein AAGA87_10300 [Pseudomonadota bacterium]